MKSLRFKKRYSRPFLRGMGSAIDLWGTSADMRLRDRVSSVRGEKYNPIQSDFYQVGLDIQDAIDQFAHTISK
jgi:hypothetical protein